ncbi:uncharacterized protein LOC132724121 [Ruditapes philippinarum]|uniref:uncharacterized protein LOC132724121 n=1 Tax=Ruditapes philippinarum TaxID=129788 RepID=UPI00295AEA8F|nr:uncharacterized protein LOC132724121 [Ruditapes philippinarum]
MSWKQTLVEKCIVINGAPRYLNKSQLSDIIQNKASTTNILLHHFQDVNNFDQWVLWLDSAESVNYLCDEIQEEQFTSDDESYTVTFLRCDESNIPEAWLELAGSSKEFGDHHDKGSFLRSHTIESTFGKESQHQQKQTPIVKTKLSNLPEDTDTEFLELFLEQELGNGIDILSIELCKNGTEAIIEFENKNVHDVLMKRQPLDVEGQKVFVELIKSQPLIQGDPRSIEVSSDKGVITERTARTIRMYFSNNGRSDGGKIVEFKFEETTEIILITFESAEVAKAVSERKDHRYRDAILNVVLIDEDLLKKRAYEDSKSMKSKAVRITNLPHEIDKDTLEVVFEDVETFGENISVVDVQLDPESSSAIIEFSETDVVERILQKKTVDVEGHTVNIEAFKEVNREEPCTVEVTGPADCLTENNIRALKMYFNNKKRSGGEDVINCCFRKPGLVEVTFEDSKVAKRVVEWDSHRFKTSNIHVNVKENKSDVPDKSNKLLFSGVDEAIKDVLVLYIEDMFENVHVKAEIPGDDESKVILEFDDSEGAKIVLQKQPLCIDGHDVGVSLYTDEPEKQCTIQVQGLPNIDKNIDALRMYFKNTNRSGGGTIVDCDCNIERNIAFITFETEEVAHSVVNRPNHELKGTMLEVTLCNLTEALQTNHVNENESTRKILIKQLPESVDKEFLELFFEDFGDSHDMLVENVEIGVNKSTAIVEFHDEAAVDFVMKQTPLKMKENIVIIERYREEEKDLSSIEVHGITDMERNLEKVLLYFKNKRRSNGGNIVSHHVDAVKNIVSITFESGEVAERVVSRDHSQQGYEVILKTDQANDEECPLQTIDTVKVRGVDKTVSLETLTYYFESKRHSGGGPIISIRRSDEDENVVFISFEDPKDASYVAGKQHTVQNCTVRVSLYQPPPCYDDKILIKGLNSTKDALFLFLEAAANVQPVRIDWHEEDESTVLVTLKEKTNFEKLEKACNERRLEGAWLKVSKVQVSQCILVSNLAPTITKDTLQYYFENKRKSGGGDVEKIVMNEDDDERTCMIFFEDYKGMF